MPFKKGQVANPKGRPKGSANKSTKQIIDMILRVATELQRSPKTSLKAIAKSNPQWFYQQVLKMALPKNIEILGDTTQKHEHDLGPETRQLLEKLYKPKKEAKNGRSN
jgi:hypothetical protein